MMDPLATITQSEEFQGLDPEKRQVFLQKLQKLTPAQRQQLADALTPTQKVTTVGHAIDPSLLEGNQMEDTPNRASYGSSPERRAADEAAIKNLWANVAGMAVTAAAPALLPARAGNLLRAGVDIAGSYLGGKTSQLLQGGSMKPNWQDAANVALPAAVHGAGALYRGAHYRAGQAVQESDAAANAIDTGNQERIATYNADRAGAETTADALNKARQEALAAHNTAQTAAPAQAKSGIDLGDYSTSYGKARAAARGAAPVDPTPLNESAAELGVSLRQPADPLQNKFTRVTDALQEFGAETGEVPLERLFATQKALGRVIGKSSGEEQGAAKKLFATTVEMLQEQAKRDPQAAEAIGHQLEAARSYMRTKAMEDFDSLFAYGRGTTDLAPGQVRVNSAQIRTKFQQLKAEDPFFTKAFSQKELGQMQEALDTTLPSTSVSQASLKTVEPKYPNPPKMDTSVPPTPAEALGSFPVGQTILGKVAGAGIGGLVGEATGMGTYPGIVAGGIAGAGIAAGPWLIARLRLSGPQGEAIVRSIMAGTNHVDSGKLVALTAAARGLGILKNDGGDQR